MWWKGKKLEERGMIKKEEDCKRVERRLTKSLCRRVGGDCEGGGHRGGSRP